MTTTLQAYRDTIDRLRALTKRTAVVTFRDGHQEEAEMTDLHPGYCDQMTMALALDQDARQGKLRDRILAEFRAMPVRLPVTPDQMAMRLNIRERYMDVRKRFSELYGAGFIDRAGVNRSLFGKRQYCYVLREGV